MMEVRLVHLQLSYKCNLRCSFCGQWGRHGYMSDGRGATDELSESEWLDVVDRIAEMSPGPGLPEFIIWGGEPLLSPAFPAVAKHLRRRGFPLAVVTNGVLLEKFAPLLAECADTVYVSLDGPEAVHEEIRGTQGIYPRIMNGLRQLSGKRPCLVGLFTLCERNMAVAADYPCELGGMGLDKLLIQHLIHCSPGRARDYRRWMKEGFGQDCAGLDSWVSEGFGDWVRALPEVTARIAGRIAAGDYPVRVELLPGELDPKRSADWYDPEIELKSPKSPCLMPWHHIHVNPDGNVHFCVDFNDFSLGNLREAKLEALLTGERAERFRRECGEFNSLCTRCPWYYNRGLRLDRKGL